MKRNIKIILNECDICKIQEQEGKKILFNIWSDVCNVCFFSNGGSINNFELKSERWVVKQPKTIEQINE